MGAEYIISGSLTNTGGIYRFRINTINVESAGIAASSATDIANDSKVQALLASGSGGSGTGARTTQPGGSVTPAASAGQTATTATPPVPTGVIKDSYAIGDTGPSGGIVFFDMGFDMDGWRYLEAAPQDIPGRFQWGVYGQNVGTQTALGSGKQNTEIIISALRSSEETVRAAQVAGAAKYGGYDDWFLPSKDELDLMYKNLKQKHLGNFQNTLYWSSSEGRENYALAPTARNNGGFAWYQSFSDGNQTLGSNSANGKNESYAVRAVRRF